MTTYFCVKAIPTQRSVMVVRVNLSSLSGVGTECDQLNFHYVRGTACTRVRYSVYNKYKL